MLKQIRLTFTILLHGSGSNGQATLSNWDSILPDHILIAPTGYLNQWNVAHEETKAPDVSFLQDLCTQLKTYENVDGNKIRILGFSNGAGLANRAYISLDEPGVDQIVAIASTFGSMMYRSGNFYIPVNEQSTGVNISNFPTIKIPLLQF